MRPLVFLLWLLSGCFEAGVDTGSTEDDLGLAGVAEVHIISLAGWGGQERSVPDTVRTHPGGAVVFEVSDFRVHTVEFMAEGMTPAQSAAIEENAQFKGPPLIERGSRYVVTFHGAPPGTYPYRITGLGEPALGAVVIEVP